MGDALAADSGDSTAAAQLSLSADELARLGEPYVPHRVVF
jgi:hypothetical protein